MRKEIGAKWNKFSEQDLALFKVTTSVDEAVEEITRFYRVYHSARTVGPRLVMRLTRAIPDTLVAALGREFATVRTGRASGLRSVGP